MQFGKLFCTVILILLITACTNQSEPVSRSEKQQLAKAKTDSLLSAKSIIVLAKVKGSTKLVRVRENRYPENLELSYNILKDENGVVVYLAELPFSSTSDWFIACRNYFNTDGSLYAFQQLNNFLHSKCTSGAAIEKTTKFYNSKFELVDSLYTLTDSKKKPVDKSLCEFPYNFKHHIIKRLAAYKAEKGITDDLLEPIN